MNEEALYNAIINLPLTASFLQTITIVATHPKFQLLEDNVNKLMESVELHGTPVDGECWLCVKLKSIRIQFDFNFCSGKFDIHQLWSDDMTFSKSGSVFCGKPFPRSDNIRFVDRIFYQEDFAGANQEELDVMPSEFKVTNDISFHFISGQIKVQTVFRLFFLFQPNTASNFIWT